MSERRGLSVDAWSGLAVPKAGRRTAPRRLNHVFEATADSAPDAIALECDGYAITYSQLDQRSNQLAHLLIGQGIGLGSRIAIFLNRSVDTYVSLLGVLKAGATFVPIDPGAPADRVAYVVDDAGVQLVLTSTDLIESTELCSVARLAMDTCSAAMEEQPWDRPIVDSSSDTDPACYVLYTSGSSGRPKGVEVAQSSICNFLDVVPEIYDVRPSDRVYQGMTISFDFSIEEIWPTWARGATVVAGPTDSRRLGGELADFLEEHTITTLYCVPTLLATIPRDLPKIRNLLVGGEACPRELVERWARPGRKILNTYGPTEATVTATWGELLPGRPVTIGRPLPTYSVVILDDARELVPHGEVGEICIGGRGVARGYVGRPDLTADRFIDHFSVTAGQKLYRTGDLGRWTPDGEIEYLGRADAEVKIRGHRVDLGEIESVLLEHPLVSEAVVALVASAPDETTLSELCAYLVLVDPREEDHLVGELANAVSQRLPAYMAPAFVDVIAALPVMPSGKVDRSKLPESTRRRFSAPTGPVVPPRNEQEVAVRDIWARAFGLPAEELSVEANFFDDLGGHSLLAATVVSALRESGIGASPSIRDLYSHPTVRSISEALAASDSQHPIAANVAVKHTDAQVARAGGIQLAVIYLFLLITTLPVSYVYTKNDGFVSVPVLFEMLAAIMLTYLCVRWFLPVVCARPLAAGIKPGRYRLWGPTYLRLWTLDLLLAVGALPVVSGSPLMSIYLRILGARVGHRTTIATSSISLPGLVEIGDGVSIGYGATIRPWRVESGSVIVGKIVVEAGAFVGANVVLEPGSTVGVRAALGDQSLLPSGHIVPQEARWAGSPAVPAESLDPAVEMMMRAESVRARWKVRHIAAAIAALAALEVGAIALMIPGIALVWGALLAWGVLAGLVATLFTGPIFVITVCVFVAVNKRLVLRNAPAGMHPVRSGLGIRKWMVDKLLEFSLLFTNSLYATLYTAPWLRLLGADIGRGAEVSTVSHIDPDMLTVGQDSFIADMASVGSASFANGRIIFQPTRIGERSFIGNAAVVPSGMEIGDNSLIGVATVPPVNGVPAGTSWLGSPAIYLPRRQDSGDYDDALIYTPAKDVVRHRLVIEFFRATLPPTVLGVSFYLYLLVLSSLAFRRALPVPALVAPLVAMASSLAVIGFCAAVKRNTVGRYRPRVEPLWSKFVRRSEFATGLYESAAVPIGVGMLVGTPFLPMVLRWFGTTIGKRVWFGTTYLTEFDLVHVGDDATIGTEASLQTHLFEDRVMKMSTITIGDGASVGTRSIILYDTIVGEEASLSPLSLLMKGEELPPRTSWRGIPAEGIRSDETQAPAVFSVDVPLDEAATEIIVTEGVPA
ncbi:Pls/PosA family non-ribosomal peptide synthetase [Rhodococcus sp. IEGM 1379]|uniref:Pls/PosA family non-ribosomal peptide synthetase n=1 Tax=Rhodococcus sp. IEGM 1379 TaxID=3047086 RepID=UPI0024B7AECC|nr:Pls/PosA family non-ribosomal peptide synthetase [Rhodococcus sp. IEGM 1379]MDI9914722.1 amino acid adenylation domain-containing protein [Rhodococcus sp. IEGM 1379]